MTELHARVDVLEGELPSPLIGAVRGDSVRRFAVLRLTRSDGTAGEGEASPLPGYSPDSLEEVTAELQRLTDAPLHVDPLASPFELLTDAFSAHPSRHASARFALETALLDWLGRTRGKPVHQILAGGVEPEAIPIVDLVMEPNPTLWAAHVEALLSDGATHLKFKIGSDLERELTALAAIRAAHPTLTIRLDGNRRIPLEGLRRHAGALESLEPELIEEPVAPVDWPAALSVPLPFALDETLRDPALSERLLDSGRIRAVVIKPMVLGGFRASFEVVERAAARDVDYFVSHTFDGPIARAASVELALALGTQLAAGLGPHPALTLWPTHRTAAIRGREIHPHENPGLGLRFEEDAGV